MTTQENKRAVRGRPREFDRTVALDSALELFWRRGYEAVSISELTAAMGLVAPSLYAAFGSKQGLFMEAFDRYQDLYGAHMGQALVEEKTAMGAVAGLLLGAAAVYTSPDTPRGCFVISAATNCSPASAAVEEALRRQRIVSEGLIRDRIACGIATGELPADTNVAALAKFYASVIQGMSIQARDGATRPELEEVANSAMTVWPRQPNISK